MGRFVGVTIIAVAAAFVSCDGSDAHGHEPNVVETRLGLPPTASAVTKPRPNVERLHARAVREFGRLSAPTAADPAKVDLGRQLWFDKRLSKNHDVACETCHRLHAYGVDNEPTSEGHGGQRGERNSPTVYNAGIHLAQFWDGRAANLVEQAKAPILNPVEMAMADEAAVLRVVESMPAYVSAFAAAFPETERPVTYENLARAIAAFEERLITPSAFDRFLAGDLAALDDDALRGLQLFFDAECTQCHTGPALGGTMYQKLGSVKPWPTADLGRFEITKNPKEKGFFKVPGLRNVTKTAPYLHDGTVATLPEIVQLMGERQTNKGRLSEPDLTALLAFLETLTGPLPEDYIAVPELPPSTPATPSPDPS